MTSEDQSTALEGFDVDAYAAKYSGRNRIERLMFLAQNVGPVHAEAQQALLRELRNSRNMALFSEMLEAARIEGLAPEQTADDIAHIENVRRSAAQQHERLEQELNSYKSTMIKESIRVQYATRCMTLG